MNEKNPKISSVYSKLLNAFDLSPFNLTHLEKRGFAKNQIEIGQYKTIPIKRKSIVENLKSSGIDFEGVPGFWKNKSDIWQLSGQTGLAIPVRDVNGHILGIKIRADKDIKAKYTQLSSNPKPDKEGNIKYPHGTAAQIHLHYPLFNKPKNGCKTIRITEGELKADIASLMSDTYTISLPGVNMWQWAFEAVQALSAERVLIAFDSDKDKEFSTSTPDERQPFAVARALASLYLGLKERGVEVHIEHWPENCGKGIDDVIVGGNEDKIILMSEDEAQKFCKGALKGTMPLEWVYIIGTKRFINTVTLQELDKEQFSDKFAPEFKKKTAASSCLSLPGFPRVDNPTYYPNQPQIITFNDQKLFNLWQDWGVEPESGSTKMFIDHCEYILPDEYERNIYLDWMAYNIQHPGEKIHWALLLQGIPGTGKSYLGFVMRKILGEKNVSNPSNDAIHESFTGWQRCCQLVVIEELMARGRLELMNKLKPMITQDIANIREMYKAPYEQPNRFNMQMFTNYEDAIIIDHTDRRYCVIFSPAEPKEPNYYKKLWDWTEQHSGRIRQWLMDRDISNFEPKGHAPMTEGKKKLISESLMPLEQWMKNCIEDKAWPFHGNLVSTRHLMNCLPQRLGRISETIVGRSLKKLGCEKVKTRILLTTGETVRLWTVRNHEIVQSADTTWLTQEYEKWSIDNQPGGNPLKDAEPI